jgi:hypothetical protein
MPPKNPTRWPTLVWTSDYDPAVVSRAARAGDLHRLAQGLYTPQPDTRAVALRDWLPILAREYPGAVITDASARAMRPVDGRLFVDHRRRSRLELPGFTIIPRAGPGPVAGDGEAPDGLWTSSIERGLLDNLAERADRSLSEDQVRDWVSYLVETRGVDFLNVVRDRARALAPVIRRQKAFDRLNLMIRRALSTGPSRRTDDASVAPVTGHPVDSARLALLQSLAEHLRDEIFEAHPALSRSAPRRRLLPFYEAYFSNYIEGSEFSLDEAAAIVFEGRIPKRRPEDAHDVLGTYRLATDREFAAVAPRDAGAFIGLLQTRHALLMAERPDVGPGELREIGVQAGGTVFPRWELVRGTLLEGFDLGAALFDPLARAVFIHFLVSEVHPFADGNGRISRLAMNAELDAAGMVRIVVPTGFRSEYLSNLTAASMDGSFTGMISAFRQLAAWADRMDFSSRESAEPLLEETNALADPRVAYDRGLKLRFPTG